MRHLNANDYVRPTALIAELLAIIDGLERDLDDHRKKLAHYEQILTIIKSIALL